jgi:hypothetical protein
MFLETCTTRPATLIGQQKSKGLLADCQQFQEDCQRQIDTCRRDRIGDGHENAGLWREPVRPADACCRRGHTCRCCLDRQLGARVPRLTARPGKSLARGVGIEHLPATRVSASREGVCQQCFDFDRAARRQFRQPNGTL